MAKILFFSHKIIDSWSEGQKIDIQGNKLTLKAGPSGPTQFHLEEAVRFLKISGSEADAPGLLGKIKTKAQLEEMGAEAYMESVIYKDIPYEVELGYLGRALEGAPPAKATAPQAQTAPPPPPPPKPEEEKLDAAQVAPDAAASDEDMLADFLLKNL